MAPLELACSSSRAFLPHAATMLASAVPHLGADARVHLLLADEIPDRERQALASVVSDRGAEPVVHTMDPERFRGLKSGGAFAKPVWFRTALGELLPETNRVIYLDSDLLVLDSLVPLWETDLGTSWLGAVTNVFPDQELARLHCERLGIDAGRYFNSGVLLLDLERMREGRAFERVREFAIANREALIFADQDSLNGALAEQRLQLHPRFNLMLGIELHPWADEVHSPEAIAEARANPVIRHFEGGTNKPWLPQAPEEARHQWERLRAQTPWATGAPSLR